MSSSNLILSGLIGAWQAFASVLVGGGWIVLVLFLALLIYNLKLKDKKYHYHHAMEWVFLSIAVPEAPSVTILAAELVFAQLHATKKTLDFREEYMLGQVKPWLSFEIVSLGGLIRYIIRAPKVQAEAVRAAFFAQYPNAEIREVSDYMEAIHIPYDPNKSDYDLWGTELQLTKSDAYPIKTYPSFEYQGGEIPRASLDPLSSLMEVFAGLNRDEMMMVQLLAEPAEDAWKAHANHEAQKLKEAGPASHSTTPTGEHKSEVKPMQGLSGKERDVIDAIQNKLSKLSFHCRLRLLYLAPKEKIETSVKVPQFLGSFTPLSTFDLNGFTKNKFTITKTDVLVSEKYEAKRVADSLLWKKREFIRNFKHREMHKGGQTFHLCTEELATLYHFPLESMRRGPIVSTEAKKGEPPVNLPV